MQVILFQGILVEKGIIIIISKQGTNDTPYTQKCRLPIK